MLEGNIKCTQCGKTAIHINRKLCNGCYLWLSRHGFLAPLETFQHRGMPCLTPGCPVVIDMKSKTGFCRKCWRRMGRDGKEKIVHRRASLKSIYKLTETQYEEMLLKQEGKCLICKQAETSVDNRTHELRRLAVDHDHETGKIRGLLCHACNMGIGYFDHSLGLLEKVVNYLNK